MQQWQEHFISLVKPEHKTSIVNENEMAFQMECFKNDSKDTVQVIVHVFNEDGVFWMEVDNAYFKQSKLMSFNEMIKCLEWAGVICVDKQ